MASFGPDVILDNPAYIHDSALLFGDIHIGPQSSVWPYVVMRCEMYQIRIGRRTNIQDFAMIRFGAGSSTTIGDNCIVGGHTLVKENTVIPDNSIVLGTPVKVAKILDNSAANRANADFYYQNWRFS